MIVCLLLPHFAATLAAQQQPHLAERPIVIGGYPWQRKHVYAASREARLAGVEPGMTISKAWLLCPDAHFLSTEEARIQARFEGVIVRLNAFTHRLEVESEIQFSPACYLDFGNLNQDDLCALVTQIQAAVQPYQAAIGVAANKFTARAAAAFADTGEVSLVEAGSETDFLASISLDRFRLPKRLKRRFHLLGIRTLGQLAQLPSASITTQFGQEGLHLYKLAHGQDDRSFQTRLPETSLHADHSFDEPIQDSHLIETVLDKLAKELAESLIADTLACRQLSLQLITADYTRHDTFVDLREPLSQADSIYEQIVAMFHRLPLTSGVLEVLVAAHRLKPVVPTQLPLFPELYQEAFLMENFAKAIQRRHRSTSVFRMKLTGEKSLLLERRFQLERIA